MYNLYTLKNGLRVIESPQKETKAVTVLVLVKVGSRYEHRAINGVSHFVEHLMFKGTKKRPTALSITKLLDGIGAEYNAFTSKDHTGYYIKASYEKVELLLDILSDIIYNSHFAAKEVERERGVIIEEINMYEDNPMMMMEDIFEQTVYGDRPLGWNIAGPKKVIGSVSRDALYAYYKKYYQPKNILVAVAGRIDKNTSAAITKYFGKQKKQASMQKFRPISVAQQQPTVTVKQKQTEQVQLAVGFPAYSYFNQRLYALSLLSVILGGNMSSRLFMSIREKKGLCYFIRSGVNIYEDTGNLMVQAGLDAKRIPEAIQAIMKEFNKIVDRGVTRHELIKAKEYVKGKMIIDLESSDTLAVWLAKQQLLKKKIMTPSQQIAKIEAVTAQQIADVSRHIIKEKKLNLALIGPVEQAAAYQRILKLS